MTSVPSKVAVTIGTFVMVVETDDITLVFPDEGKFLSMTLSLPRPCAVRPWCMRL